MYHSTNCHNVTGLNLSDIKQIGATGSFTRDINFKVNGLETSITLFADKREDLEIAVTNVTKV